MKTKILSVIAAASLAVTSFAALTITASAAETINLADLTGNCEAQDGDVLTGTMSGNYKITIADGAAVTLKNVTINGTKNYRYKWAGITPLGDATIILEGTNSVTGFYEEYPGVFAAVGKTLTIKGNGSLTASSNGNAAGIGGGRELSCGNIVIEGGCINATGGNYSPGIGGGAKGYSSESTVSCGDITITDGVTGVTATKGVLAPNSIGAGKDGTCGTVTIGGVEGSITESPYIYQPDKESATAAYAQVGTDYTSETATDNIASLWKITVTAGTDSIETLDVKLGAVSSKEGTQSLDTPAITDAEVVLGVVTNLSGTDTEARGFTVVVNGSDIAAAKASN